MMNRRYSPHYSQAAFTLIEVLVTVLVLSIGLLGLAGLQMTSLRSTHASLLRSIATMEAYDMADRMRVNKQGVEEGLYNNPTATASSACESTSGCSYNAMAQNDYYEWRNNLHSLMPDGLGYVCIDSNPDDNTTLPAAGTPSWCDGVGNIYVITVQWSERGRSGKETHTLSMSFQP